MNCHISDSFSCVLRAIFAGVFLVFFDLISVVISLVC